MRKVHVTYTEPVAGYALGAWGPFISHSNLERIERKQREAARIITGFCKDTKSELSRNLLAEARLMPFNSKIEQESALLYERNMRLS